MKIISGGQTGVDRAALDVALNLGIDCGGWCPAGRLDEFGRIPDRYPLQELAHGGFVERTLQNVKDADGTIMIYAEKLIGGTRQTARFCAEQRKPHLSISAMEMTVEEAAALIANFVNENRIHLMNVAGPRQTEWRDGYDFVYRTLEIFLKQIQTKRKREILDHS